jgi:hypothetical protein
VPLRIDHQRPELHQADQEAEDPAALRPEAVPERPVYSYRRTARAASSIKCIDRYAKTAKTKERTAASRNDGHLRFQTAQTKQTH